MLKMPCLDYIIIILIIIRMLTLFNRMPSWTQSNLPWGHPSKTTNTCNVTKQSHAKIHIIYT